MKKELLEQRKNEILAHKKELEKNKNQKENLVSENEKLNIEYKEIVDSIVNLKKEMNEYIRSKRINKFSKILLIVSIISVLGIFGLVKLTSVVASMSLASNITAVFVMTFLLGGIVSVPYFSTRNYIKNTNIEEIKAALNLEQLKMNQNIEKCELNDKKIENIDNRKLELEEEVYRITVALLRDEDERNEVITEMLDNYPSFEFVEAFTNTMYEKSKIKLKK